MSTDLARMRTSPGTSATELPTALALLLRATTWEEAEQAGDRLYIAVCNDSTGVLYEAAWPVFEACISQLPSVAAPAKRYILIMLEACIDFLPHYSETDAGNDDLSDRISAKLSEAQAVFFDCLNSKEPQDRWNALYILESIASRFDQQLVLDVVDATQRLLLAETHPKVIEVAQVVQGRLLR